MPFVRVPASALMLVGFRAWATSDEFPEDLRAAFIGQELFLNMSNEEPETHVAVNTEVVRVLAALERQLKLGKFYSDGVLVTNEAADLSNNPDASFLSRAIIQSGRARLVPRQGGQGAYREVVGTPDWVLGVVGDSSVEKDTQLLRQAYHRAGISEYWLIDSRGDELVFQVLYRRKRGYAPASRREGWQHARVFGRSFRLVRQRDEFDLWEYTLKARDV